MPYFAEVAKRQGSAEYEYTDVHGPRDVVHSHELFGALHAEMTLSRDPMPPVQDLLEGVGLLRTLIHCIVQSRVVELRTP